MSSMTHNGRSSERKDKEQTGRHNMLALVQEVFVANGIVGSTILWCNRLDVDVMKCQSMAVDTFEECQ